VSARLKLPAYARALIEKRARGLAPVRDFCISCDWGLGHAWPWRVVVAPEDNPELLDFRVVAGLSCLLVGTDRERMDAVARSVMRWRPRRLVGVCVGDKVSTIYVTAATPARVAA
jgi:hypothetical protein